ncbi:MAG TPA: flagellar basal body P-ring protein FlgI, partial [Phycisphaerales bacterium]|nr:flagellar basal body P-ring protein FlgI [Phycisphaerales bacterium]
MITRSSYVVSRLVVALFPMFAFACSNVEKADPQPQSARVDHSFQIDTPQILRGTIASEAVLLGWDSPVAEKYQPVVVRGYGLVVGLHGTGSRDIPPQIRAYMLGLASKYEVGSVKYGDRNSRTPDELIDSPDTAVVIVEAVVPQGAVKGTLFDVRVSADPRTGTASLEGGSLWTTELRPGALTAGGAQAAALAEAHGPLFINPFAEPNAVGKDSINRLSGRIMNGGVILKDMPLKLRVGSPGHTRVAMLITAINTRFPKEPGMRDPTARGESDESIQITVPPSYRDDVETFVQRLRHTSIQQANPEAIATSIKRILLASPVVADAACWRWQALGPRCLPVIKELYDYSEEAPRMAALEAGAKLQHPLVTPHLITMASEGSLKARLKAIALLGKLNNDPQIDVELRKLLNDDDIEIRLAAYESLVERRDVFVHREIVDNKFIIDVVESGKPLIYITQVGQPRIVIFGTSLNIDRPVTLTTWSDRLMMKGDAGDDEIEVYYRAENDPKGSINRITPSVEALAQFLGHRTTVDEPDPGL